MDNGVFAALSAQPALSPKGSNVAKCKVCRSPAHFFDVVDFNKFCSPEDCYFYGSTGIPVSYARCGRCGFIFTNFFDGWTPQEFSRFVYNDDYILVDGEYAGARPARDAAMVADRLQGLHDLRILDYGSGSGQLTEHLKSHGFGRVESYDPFSSPRRPTGTFEVVTCFEVLEHSTDPLATLADIGRLTDRGGLIIFSTGIQPETIGLLRANWWYIAPRNGHASIHTLESLALLAQASGFSLFTGDGVMAFGRPGASAKSVRILSSIGRRILFFQLTAPGPDTPPADDYVQAWHGVESDGLGSFRWTRESRVSWRLQTEPLAHCTLSVTLPLRMEIEPGFASASTLSLGDVLVPFSQSGNTVRASLNIDAPVEPVITLMTPAPIRPCDRSSTPDQRPLGLAIATQ